MIATVANGSILWSKSYPVAGADPEKIAAEVSSKLPPLDDDEAAAAAGTGHDHTVIVAPGIK
jgi:hypothetical protein